MNINGIIHSGKGLETVDISSQLGSIKGNSKQANYIRELFGNEGIKESEPVKNSSQINSPVSMDINTTIDEVNIRNRQMTNNAIQDKVTFFQIADNALKGIQGKLEKLTELTKGYTNPSWSKGDKGNISESVSDLLSEINEQFENAIFKGENVFDNKKDMQEGLKDIKEFLKDIEKIFKQSNGKGNGKGNSNSEYDDVIDLINKFPTNSPVSDILKSVFEKIFGKGNDKENGGIDIGIDLPIGDGGVDVGVEIPPIVPGDIEEIPNDNENPSNGGIDIGIDLPIGDGGVDVGVEIPPIVPGDIEEIPNDNENPSNGGIDIGIDLPIGDGGIDVGVGIPPIIPGDIEEIPSDDEKPSNGGIDIGIDIGGIEIGVGIGGSDKPNPNQPIENTPNNNPKHPAITENNSGAANKGIHGVVVSPIWERVKEKEMNVSLLNVVVQHILKPVVDGRFAINKQRESLVERLMLSNDRFSNQKTQLAFMSKTIQEKKENEFDYLKNIDRKSAEKILDTVKGLVEAHSNINLIHQFNDSQRSMSKSLLYAKENEQKNEKKLTVEREQAYESTKPNKSDQKVEGEGYGIKEQSRGIQDVGHNSRKEWYI